MQHPPTTQRIDRIGFTNHLMFNAVLTENEDLCMRLIGAVLGAKVESIEFIEDETTIQPTVDARGARLDILARINGEYVDIEMQVGIEPQIARRCRFYHSAIATRYTPKSRGYESVPKSCVIFICLRDPLGAGLPRYELATTCKSNPEVTVDDGAVTVILNASAWEREQDPVVSGLLEYALTGIPSNGLARDIEDAVTSKNLDRKWVRASMGVMTYEHEFLVLNQELEKRRAEVAAIKAEISSAEAMLEAAKSEAEAARAQTEAAKSETEAARAQTEAAKSETEAARAQTEAARAEARAIRELSRRLIAEGRADEYVAALDDPQLMAALLKECGLSS